jgi:hypothetical protein
MVKLVFTVPSISINLTADNLNIENYTQPGLQTGYAFRTTLPLAQAKKIFAVITNDTNVSIADSMTSLYYAILPKTSNDFSQIPDASTFKANFSPNLGAGYTYTEYTGSTATTDNTLSDDLARRTYVALTRNSTDIASALNTADKKFQDGTSLFGTPVGITNRAAFVGNTHNAINNKFSQALSNYKIGPNGLGTIYSAAPPLDENGNPTYLNPTVEVLKQMFISDSERLSLANETIDLTGLGVTLAQGYQAVSLPFKADDVIDANITVSSTQVNKDGATISPTTYRLSIQIVA